MPLMLRRFALVALGLTLGGLVSPRPGVAQDAAAALAATQRPGGLAIHVGTTDGRLEADLAAGGTWLVHGVTTDAAARDRARAAIQAKGRYGLGSVESVRTYARLPYADHLANLVIADLDALGPAAPARDELVRVLCPGGVAYLKAGGKWTATPKPRPADTDDWTHFDYGPEGNGVSQDRQVRQPNFVQWIAGVQPIKLGGNPAGFIGLTGIRVAAGRCVFDWVPEGKSNRASMLACRDAYNGVPLWTQPRDYDAGRKRWGLVAVGTRVYTQLKRNGPLVALDAATGKVLVDYTAAGPLTGDGDANQVRVGPTRLLVNNADTLSLLNAADGKLLWQFKDESGGPLLFPCLSEPAGKAFVMVSAPAPKVGGRWPWAPAQAVVCLDLATGKVLWRNTAVAGKPIGQLIYADGHLALFCGSAISGRGEGGWISSITVADGKLNGEGTFKVAWNDSMYNAVIRDGATYYAGHTSIYRADLASGAINKMVGLSYNQRCNRFAATVDRFIWGYVTYLDKDYNGTLQSATRAGCALGGTPANGMVYFTPSACGCFTQFRGYSALTPEAIGTPWPDDQRLERGTPPAAKAPATIPAPPDGPLTQDWTRNEHAPALETEPVDVAGAKLVAVVHQHRVELRSADGAVKWSFTAGGRVSHPPVVQDGLALFGSHDGWVYAVRLADGALAWRYLVAPYERKVGAYGQLESSWPVYGVILHQGLACASGGVHPEIGGGVVVVGLKPASGEVAFRRTLAKRVATITTTNGKASGTIVPHSFLNAVLTSDGERLALGKFSFSPDESDADLQQRLDTPPAKKK